MQMKSYIKAISLPLIFLLGLLPGLLPLLCKRFNRSSRALHYANAFSGGVFLAIAVLHIFPEVIEDYANLRGDKKKLFPLPHLVFLFGFVLILALEKVFCAHKNYKFKKPKEQNSDKQQSSRVESNHQSFPGDGLDDALPRHTESAASENHDHIHIDFSSKSWLTPVILLIALSVHSLFEGLALGVSATREQVLGLLFGIAIHKWAASFSIGINFATKVVQRDDLKKGILLLTLFAVATPLGIGIGWIVLNYASPLVSVIFSALAGGTFLYIGSSEIVVSEFTTRKPKTGRLIFFTLGIVIVAITNVIEAKTISQ